MSNVEDKPFDREQIDPDTLLLIDNEKQTLNMHGAMTINQEGLPKVDESVLMWITEPYPRPLYSKKTLVFRVESIDGDMFEIPWPEGQGVTGALKEWAVNYVLGLDLKQAVAPASHWSDCEECYDYHEGHHDDKTSKYVPGLGKEVVGGVIPQYDKDELPEHRDFRHLD